MDKKKGPGIVGAGRSLLFPKEEFGAAFCDPVFVTWLRMRDQTSLVTCHGHPAR